MDPRLIRKVRRRDRIAGWVITGSAMLVIVCVLGILVLIAQVAIPLFLPPSVDSFSSLSLPRQEAPARPMAVGLDPYLETAFVLREDGAFTFFDTVGGRELVRRPVAPPSASARRVIQVDAHGELAYGLLWNDGSLSVVRVEFLPRFDEAGHRTIGNRVEILAERQARPGEPVPELSSARFHPDAGMTQASVLPGNRIAIHKQVLTTNLLGGQSSEAISTEISEPLPGRITALILASAGDTLYAATSNGYLLRWDIRDLDDVRLLDRLPAFADRRAVTALGLLQGEVTLAVGDERGGVSGWFPVRTSEGGRERLALIHRLKPHDSAVVDFIPSLKSKTMVSLDRDGVVHIDHFTNERHLIALRDDRALVMAGLTVRANGLIAIDASGRVRIWRVDIPHPEVSWGRFFGPVWYESYPQPDYVWQSSAGTDDYEPKLSIVPLIFGTLKGTFYGMLFAVPLAVLGAMYTSSLMQVRLRRYIKPVFEIMASVPTVVIGFLAALWLAPIVKASFTAWLLMIGFLPLMVIAAMYGAERLGRLGFLTKAIRGYEFLFLVPMIVLAAYLSYLAGQAADALLFGGGLTHWMFEAWGVRFEQRNSIVIACALGFAVLPTVFTLSDDALGNVPRHLTAASLALGASRWQTVARVVLPSASPGIFAALMVGLGRAVGETMIVLMATGNTPIMDWSAFNGMRTLAANMAVEIPEAPQGGTLFRTLFLSAVLLFLTTFVLNSMAEVVRIRLRKRFGQY